MPFSGELGNHLGNRSIPETPASMRSAAWRTFWWKPSSSPPLNHEGLEFERIRGLERGANVVRLLQQIPKPRERAHDRSHVLGVLLLRDLGYRVRARLHCAY